MSAPARYPRLRGLLSGDDRTWWLFFGGGLAISALFHTELLREKLAPTPAGPGDVLACLLLVAALFWRSLLGHGYRWLHPAWLTWQDGQPGARDHALSRRLLAAWSWRLAALAYLAVAIVQVHGAPTAWILAGGALLAALALLALAATVSTVASAVVVALPLGLAVVAVVQLTGFGVTWLGVLAGFCLVSGVVVRLRWPAPPAGRVDLVEGWATRATQSAAIQFLDPMLVLPSARPVRARWLRRVRWPVLRLAVLGVLGRSRFFVPWLLLAVLAVFAQRAVPSIPPVWVVLVTAYFALVPFGAQLGELHSRSGLRRWLSTRDRTARIVHAGVLAVLGLLWTAVVLTVGGLALAGVGTLAAALAMVVPLTVAAVVRTAGRPPPRYDDLGTVDAGLGQVPVRLVLQSVRGPDVAVLGTLFAAAGVGLVVLVPVIVALVAWGVLR
jgi:hypothetical protein